MKTRGFEVVSGYENKGINLPVRATHGAAGYDFEACEDVVIPTIWKQGISKVIVALMKGEVLTASEEDKKKLKPTLVPTGVKSYMQENEYLQLCNRSSNPIKRFLVLGNGVGVIDSDYYNNSENEGHIMFQFINFGLTDMIVKKGERIGQGIFLSFLKSDQDYTVGERTGGFGSSGN